MIFYYDQDKFSVEIDGDGSVWWWGIEVARTLDDSNLDRKIHKQLRDDQKRLAVRIGEHEMHRDSYQINTLGLLRLIFTSRSDRAEGFERWVTHDVVAMRIRTCENGIPKYYDLDGVTTDTSIC